MTNTRTPTETVTETARSQDRVSQEPAPAAVKGPGPVPTPDEPSDSYEGQLQSTLDKLWKAAEGNTGVFFSGLQARALASLIVGITQQSNQLIEAAEKVQEPTGIWVPPAPGQGMPKS